MIHQTVNQTKAQAILAAQEIANEHGNAWVWRSGKSYWASVEQPHPDSVSVYAARRAWDAIQDIYDIARSEQFPEFTMRLWNLADEIAAIYAPLKVESQPFYKLMDAPGPDLKHESA